MNQLIKLSECVSWIKNNKKKFFNIFLSFLFFATIIVGLVVFIVNRNLFFKIVQTNPRYAQGFVLVDDKISQGANITINVPSFSSKEEMSGNLKFDPVIKGALVNTEDQKKIVFKPKEVLKLGNYYKVVSATRQGTISKDFQIVPPPQIEAVFPKSGSEANEKSNITIIFSRPMVALTTLDEQAKKDIPVEITPETKGKFKWIGTKTLQFIPDDTLIPSSSYTVKIKAGFKSIEDLNIAGLEHKFITRPLRYENLDTNTIVRYNEPLKIYYNQAVDLDKTTSEISIINTGTNGNIAFVAEYGEKEIYDERSGKFIKTVDESSIFIYNKEDKYGRNKFWDFDNHFHFKINKAYPKRGDIILNESREADFQSTGIIESLTAESEKSNYASSKLFDPSGRLVVVFYEEIDKDKSKINSDKITNIVYGEKCKEGTEFYDQSQCEKEIDKKKIIISFAADKINKGENIEIGFNKVYNTDGLLINAKPVVENIKAYSDLIIFKTIPGDNAINAGLNEIIICANSPITKPASQDLLKKNIGQYIQSNLDFEVNDWYAPSLVTFRNPRDNGCEIGQYQTQIEVGLMPEENYQMKFKLLDDFGQTAEESAFFSTGKMPSAEMNFFHYQNKYNVTTPNKTKLTYAAYNMDYVNMTICQLKPEAMLGYLAGKIDYWQGPNEVKDCLKTVNKKITLPKKYWIKNYFQVDLKEYVSNPKGHYMLTFTNPNYLDYEKRQVFERSYLTITNLSIIEKKLQLYNNKDTIEQGNNLSEKQLAKTKNIYWITRMDNLEPVAKAEVKFFSTDLNDNQKNKVMQTNAKGILEMEPIDRLNGLVVKSGDDSALISVNSQSSLNSGDNAYSAQMIYVYTDRPIYRPSQTVYFKGIYRIGFDADYEIFREKKVAVKIYNASNEVVFDKAMDVSDFGTFNGELILDSSAPLGSYRIEANGSSANFDVEEYAPAAFKVEARSDKEEYIAKENFNIDVEASYYFGAPVEGGTVEYAIAAQNYYFDKYQGEYFDFGNSWYYCGYDCSYGDQFILRNTTKLDAHGKGKIVGQADLEKLAKDGNRSSKIFVVYITVKNSSGQSVSTQKSFIVHAGDFYLGLNTDNSFLSKNQKFVLKAKSVNIQGGDVSVKDVKLTINRINWVYAKRKEVDGGYYYDYQKKLDLVSEQIINTDGKGNWSGDFSLNKEGEYEIRALGKDQRGNEISTIYSIYVYGEGQVDVRPVNDQTLEVVAEKNYLNVGDTGKIIIKSPFRRAKALISIERGKIFQYDVVDINQNIYEYNFPVTEEYIPSVNVATVLLSTDPEVKYGSVNFGVNTKEKELTITATPNKDVYLPGEDMSINYFVQDSAGRPVETEISTAVADLSVLALKGNPKKNPVNFFYNYFPFNITTVSNVKNILYETDLPVIASKGGGGAEPDDLAKKKRGVFKDTAFWQATIRTDKNGRAESKFTLPDNLTTWQIESLGVSQDTKLGVAYKELMARKDLMVVPLVPRFIMPGDEFMIGGKIFNQTKEKQQLEVSLESGTIRLEDDKTKKIDINAGETKNIYFKVSSPESIQSGSHKFIISAKNEKYEDTVEGSVTINRNNTYETVATSNYAKDAVSQEYFYLPENIVKDQGGLAVNTSATLAVYLTDALNYLLEYPYGCSEQIASKLNAIAAVKKGTSIKNIGDKIHLNEIELNGKKYSQEEAVEIGLNEIYKNYIPKEGFSYYPGGRPNYYLTLYVGEVLSNLKESGFAVRDEIYKNLPIVIREKYYSLPISQKNENLLILTAYTLSKYSDSTIDNQIIKSINNLEKNEKFLNENASNLALADLAILLNDKKYDFNKNFKDKIYKIMENRIDIDSRGAFLKPNGNLMWEIYENRTKDTALFLKSMVIGQRESGVEDRLLRWLLNSRSKDGAWETTNNTISVIDAMADYINWKQENKSAFALNISVNNINKGTFAYGPENILEQNSLLLPVNNLQFGIINTLNFAKTNRNNATNNFYYDISLKYYLPVDQLPPRDEGFYIKRALYALDDKDNETALDKAKVGDVLKGHLEIVVPKDRNFVAIEDFIPAGMELVNFNLATEDQSLQLNQTENNNPAYGYNTGYGNNYYDDGRFYPDKEEKRDDRLFLFKENLAQGAYTYDYYVRALIPGNFHHLPAIVSEMYFPENFGRTSGGYFTVNQN